MYTVYLSVGVKQINLVAISSLNLKLTYRLKFWPSHAVEYYRFPASCITLHSMFTCLSSVCHLLWRHALMGATQDGGVKTFDRRVFPLFSEQARGLPAFRGRYGFRYCLIQFLIKKITT